MSNPLVSLPAARLHLVSESPELRAPQKNTAMELKPINYPSARPAPHPICLLIPSADDDELQDLTDDIRAHGLIDPIVLFEGMILDGRNRAAACERAGIAPRYVQFGGGREDALILVVSHNLKRRHLTKQAIADALVAAEDFNLHYTLAEPGAAAQAAADSPEAQSVIKITEPKTASSRKLAQAAGRVVSHVMIAATRKVKEKGEPELQEAVKRGRIGVQDAAKVADLLPEQQKAIAESPKPRRAAAEVTDAAKVAASCAGGSNDGDGHAALQKAWRGGEGAAQPMGNGRRQNEGMVCRRGFVRFGRGWRARRVPAAILAAHSQENRRALTRTVRSGDLSPWRNTAQHSRSPARPLAARNFQVMGKRRLATPERC